MTHAMRLRFPTLNM
ncbi:MULTISPECIES: erythromycin resistance leader peptide [Virgibacillus]|nr:hypothetical protein [Virgibacillus massiliensis]